MNWFDIALILILCLSIASSFRKGLSREIIGLVSVVAGLVLGVWFYGSAAALIEPYLSSPLAAKFGGFLMVFFGVILLGTLVRFIVGKFLKVTGLSVFDHALGALFGAARGGLICVALVTGMMAFAKDGHPPDAVLHSRIAPYVASGGRLAAAIAPHELSQGFDKSYQVAKSAWTSAVEQASRRVTDEKGKK